MPTPRRLLILLAFVPLTACAPSLVSLKTPSTGPTKSLVPTVSCSENAPDVPLPPFPAPSANVQQFEQDQIAWGIGAIGAYSHEKLLRKATAQCLADLRSKGIIN